MGPIGQVAPSTESVSRSNFIRRKEGKANSAQTALKDLHIPVYVALDMPVVAAKADGGPHAVTGMQVKTEGVER